MRQGYSHLTGVDIMPSAIRRSRELFPDLPENTLVNARIDTFVDQLDAASVDLFFAHSAVLELIHPCWRSADSLFKALRPGGHCVLLLNERGHSYPRYWSHLFRRSGLLEVERESICSDKEYVLSLVVWRRP